MVNSSHIIALGPSGAAGPIPDIGGTGPTGPIGVTGPTGERGITGTLGSSGIGFGYCGPTAPLVFQHYDDKDNAIFGVPTFDYRHYRYAGICGNPQTSLVLFLESESSDAGGAVRGRTLEVPGNRPGIYNGIQARILGPTGATGTTGPVLIRSVGSGIPLIYSMDGATAQFKVIEAASDVQIQVLPNGTIMLGGIKANAEDAIDMGITGELVYMVAGTSSYADGASGTFWDASAWPIGAAGGSAYHETLSAKLIDYREMIQRHGNQWGATAYPVGWSESSRVDLQLHMTGGNVQKVYCGPTTGYIKLPYDNYTNYTGQTFALSQNFTLILHNAASHGLLAKGLQPVDIFNSTDSQNSDYIVPEFSDPDAVEFSDGIDIFNFVYTEQAIGNVPGGNHKWLALTPGINYGITFDGLPDEMGACCSSSYENGCQDYVTRSECNVIDGNFHLNTTCTNELCDDTVIRGACCSMGSCISDVPSEWCEAIQGYHFSNLGCEHVDCNDYPCGDPIPVQGACCIEQSFDNEICYDCIEISGQEACEGKGGFWHGYNVHCWNEPCPGDPCPSTACCWYDDSEGENVCGPLSLATCSQIGGDSYTDDDGNPLECCEVDILYHGVGCAGAGPICIWRNSYEEVEEYFQEAYNLSIGNCLQIEQWTCVEGQPPAECEQPCYNFHDDQWWPTSPSAQTICESGDCPDCGACQNDNVLGCCCANGRKHSFFSADDCTKVGGQWTATTNPDDGTDGSCEGIDCSGTGPGTDCINCTTTGACCRLGFCTDETEETCTTDGTNGTYQGDNTICDDIDCCEFLFGACCYSDGSCVDNIYKDDCEDPDNPGNWSGWGSSCSSDPCGNPEDWGACCCKDDAGDVCNCVYLPLSQCVGVAGCDDCSHHPGDQCIDVSCEPVVPCDDCIDEGKVGWHIYIDKSDCVISGQEGYEWATADHSFIPDPRIGLTRPSDGYFNTHGWPSQECDLVSECGERNGPYNLASLRDTTNCPDAAELNPVYGGLEGGIFDSLSLSGNFNHPDYSNPGHNCSSGSCRLDLYVMSKDEFGFFQKQQSQHSSINSTLSNIGNALNGTYWTSSRPLGLSYVEDKAFSWSSSQGSLDSESRSNSNKIRLALRYVGTSGSEDSGPNGEAPGDIVSWGDSGRQMVYVGYFIPGCSRINGYDSSENIGSSPNVGACSEALPKGPCCECAGCSYRNNQYQCVNELSSCQLPYCNNCDDHLENRWKGDDVIYDASSHDVGEYGSICNVTCSTIFDADEGVDCTRNNSGERHRKDCLPQGTCCYSDGTCDVIPKCECDAIGTATWIEGETEGDCNNICTPDPKYPCCVDGNCICCYTIQECSNLGGSPQTDDSDCNNVICPPTGRCCYDYGNSSCLETTLDICNNTYGGDWDEGFDCNTNPCDLTVGACCDTQNGSCTDDVSLPDCSGKWMGGGTSCGNVDCSCSLCGACCYDNGSCVDGLTEGECSGGGEAWQGIDSVCEGVDCIEPPLNLNLPNDQNCCDDNEDNINDYWCLNCKSYDSDCNISDVCPGTSSEQENALLGCDWNDNSSAVFGLPLVNNPYMDITQPGIRKVNDTSGEFVGQFSMADWGENSGCPCTPGYSIQDCLNGTSGVDCDPSCCHWHGNDHEDTAHHDFFGCDQTSGIYNPVINYPLSELPPRNVFSAKPYMIPATWADHVPTPACPSWLAEDADGDIINFPDTNRPVGGWIDSADTCSIDIENARDYEKYVSGSGFNSPSYYCPPYDGIINDYWSLRAYNMEMWEIPDQSGSGEAIGISPCYSRRFKIKYETFCIDDRFQVIQLPWPKGARDEKEAHQRIRCYLNCLLESSCYDPAVDDQNPFNGEISNLPSHIDPNHYGWLNGVKLVKTNDSSNNIINVPVEQDCASKFLGYDSQEHWILFDSGSIGTRGCADPPHPETPDLSGWEGKNIRVSEDLYSEGDVCEIGVDCIDDGKPNYSNGYYNTDQSFTKCLAYNYPACPLRLDRKQIELHWNIDTIRTDWEDELTERLKEGYGPGGQGPLPPFAVGFANSNVDEDGAGGSVWNCRVSECGGRTQFFAGTNNVSGIIGGGGNAGNCDEPPLDGWSTNPPEESSRPPCNTSTTWCAQQEETESEYRLAYGTCYCNNCGNSSNFMKTTFDECLCRSGIIGAGCCPAGCGLDGVCEELCPTDPDDPYYDEDCFTCTFDTCDNTNACSWTPDYKTSSGLFTPCMCDCDDVLYPEEDSDETFEEFQDECDAEIASCCVAIGKYGWPGDFGLPSTWGDMSIFDASWSWNGDGSRLVGWLCGWGSPAHTLAQSIWNGEWTDTVKYCLDIHTCPALFNGEATNWDECEPGDESVKDGCGGNFISSALGMGLDVPLNAGGCEMSSSSSPAYGTAGDPGLPRSCNYQFNNGFYTDQSRLGLRGCPMKDKDCHYDYHNDGTGWGGAESWQPPCCPNPSPLIGTDEIEYSLGPSDTEDSDHDSSTNPSWLYDFGQSGLDARQFVTPRDILCERYLGPGGRNQKGLCHLGHGWDDPYSIVMNDEICGPPSTGACCSRTVDGEQQCSEGILEGDCGGYWAGENSSCDEDCQWGACCIDGVCYDNYTESLCDNDGGNWVGEVECNDDDVEEGCDTGTLGACCYRDGDNNPQCLHKTHDQCLAVSGIFHEGEGCSSSGNHSPCIGSCCYTPCGSTTERCSNGMLWTECEYLCGNGSSKDCRWKQNGNCYSVVGGCGRCLDDISQPDTTYRSCSQNIILENCSGTDDCWYPGEPDSLVGLLGWVRCIAGIHDDDDDDCPSSCHSDSFYGTGSCFLSSSSSNPPEWNEDICVSDVSESACSLIGGTWSESSADCDGNGTPLIEYIEQPGSGDLGCNEEWDEEHGGVGACCDEPQQGMANCHDNVEESFCDFTTEDWVVCGTCCDDVECASCFREADVCEGAQGSGSCCYIDEENNTTTCIDGVDCEWCSTYVGGNWSNDSCEDRIANEEMYCCNTCNKRGNRTLSSKDFREKAIRFEKNRITFRSRIRKER